MNSQQLLQVPPTKSALLHLKRQAAFLEDGHLLLERKRELLTRLVYERIGEYRKQREKTHEAIKRAYHWLSVAQLRMGSRGLQQAGFGSPPTLAVNIIAKRSMGVEYPAVSTTKLPLEPVGLLGTDASFDEARKELTEATMLMIRLGEAEMALARLMAEQRKAQKRVNALKYNIIPRYHRTIHHIESHLEEEERDMLYQIKVLREQNGEHEDEPYR